MTRDVEALEGKEGSRFGADVGAGETVGVGGGSTDGCVVGDLVPVAAEGPRAGMAVPAGAGVVGGWTARDKFGVVVETAGLPEAQLAEYCLKKGLYTAQIATWRQVCEAGVAAGRNEVGPTLRDERRRVGNSRRSCGARSARWRRPRRC